MTYEGYDEDEEATANPRTFGEWPWIIGAVVVVILLGMLLH